MKHVNERPRNQTPICLMKILRSLQIVTYHIIRVTWWWDRNEKPFRMQLLLQIVKPYREGVCKSLQFPRMQYQCNSRLCKLLLKHLHLEICDLLYCRVHSSTCWGLQRVSDSLQTDKIGYCAKEIVLSAPAFIFYPYSGSSSETQTTVMSPSQMANCVLPFYSKSSMLKWNLQDSLQ